MFLFIDGHSLIYRAYYALLRSRITDPNARPIAAVFGFMKMFVKIVKELEPEYIAVAFDKGKSFRVSIFPEYKAKRMKPPEDFPMQLELLKELLEKANIKVIEIELFEADDILATLVKMFNNAGINGIILSGDKDVLQLINSRTKVLLTKRGVSETKLYDEKTFFEEYGIRPENLIDLKAIMGDSSDNIPGVKGIGEKGAFKLLRKYYTLDNLYNNLEKVGEKIKNKLIESKELAYKSYELAKVKSDVPLNIKIEDLRFKGFSNLEFKDALERFAFKSIMSDLKFEERNNTDYKSPQFNIRIPESLEEIKEFIFGADKFLSIDIETDSNSKMEAHVIGIGLCFNEKEILYIPVSHTNTNNFSLSDIIKLLSRFCEQGGRFIGHNLGFDLLILKRKGFSNFSIYFDTMIASYVLNPSRNSHSLKKLASEYLNLNMQTFKELTQKEKISLSDIPVFEVAKYCGADVVVSLKLYEIFFKKLEETNLSELYFNIEIPLITVLIDMELTGIKIDVDYLNKLDEVMSKEIDDLKTNIYIAAGKKFNINSSQQLGQILFVERKNKVVKRTTKQKNFSTDAEVLATLAAHDELASLVLRYRIFTKLKNTYVQGLLKAINPVTGRLHASFNQTITATGRLSSSKPNLQNIPVKTPEGRKIRKAFIAEKGFELISFDYSQVELRVLAHLSKDPAMMKAVISGEDIHRTTASQIFNIPYEEVSSFQRAIAKSINFGLIYGKTVYGLAKDLRISRHQAKEYIENYFKRFSHVKKFFDEIIEFGREKGYVYTILGRRRYLKELNSRNTNIRNHAERMAKNTVVQGSAADLIKKAMIDIHRFITDNSLKTRLLLSIHDELVFEVFNSEHDFFLNKAKFIMENAIRLRVPLLAKIGKFE